MAHWTGRLDTRLAGCAASASGGEAQRIALARALLAAPSADLVLLDEPTAHLDPPTARRVLREIRALPATVLHVTHRPEETTDADLVITLRGSAAGGPPISTLPTTPDTPSARERICGQPGSLWTTRPGTPDFNATRDHRQFWTAE